MRRTPKLLMVLFIATVLHGNSFGQGHFPALDSTLLYVKDSVRPFIKRFENLRFTGYIQPQFQVASSEGSPSYNGGNFSTFSKSRFMLRRARIKLEYIISTPERLPKALFTFQIDATERGVNVRDMFVKLFETRHQNFSMTAGIFGRPFGFEINYSSSSRETPERGRMSQILMPGERDLGVMISYEPKGKKRSQYFRLDAGVFNGQGLAGPTDFDSRKDIISRVMLKPVELGTITISGGLSLLYGGWRQATKYVYETGSSPAGKTFLVDSSLSNIGDIAPRRYYGADLQLAIPHGWGETELRGEYWRGTQPGTETSTTSPGTQPPGPTYIREFDGAFLLFLQNIVNRKHQVMVKYDWYDPNRVVADAEIGAAGTAFSAADIKYSTLGLGYTYHLNNNIKFILYFDRVINEKTQLPGFTTDLDDNIFTGRIQLKF